MTTTIITDGHHTMDELYMHRMYLTLTITKLLPYRYSWRSKLHHDGTMQDGNFIVGFVLNGKTITYHYGIEHWDKFNHVLTLERAPKWDGHTPDDCLKRMEEFAKTSINTNITLSCSQRDNTDGYYQTSNFTCGPAALMTCFHTLRKTYTYETIEEYNIWLQTNSIFMSEGHPGCSLYGLGIMAIVRSFQTKLYVNLKEEDSLFSEWIKDDHELAVYQVREKHLEETYKVFGGSINRSLIDIDLLREHSKLGYVAAILTSDPLNRVYGHYICVKMVDAKNVLLFDPYKGADYRGLAKSTDKGYVMPINEFVQFMYYGKNKKQACLFIK